MNGSIERGWRSVTRLSLAPVLMLVVGANGPSDPTRKATGYGGILPVPASATSPATAATHPEPLLDQQRRELRAARGRVLYADGHGPQAPAKRTERGAKCPPPERRVVDSRVTATPSS
jgi:hypothetical protein